MSDDNRLHQISAGYIAEEDRILLRFNTAAQAEFRFWITRRYLALLWQVALKILDRFTGNGLPADSTLRAELASLTHAGMTTSADLSTPYREGNRFPLGKQPLLLTRITPLPGSPLHQGLRLEPAQGEGIDINLDEKLAHNLLRILHDAAIRAEWGLDLKVSAAPDAQKVTRPGLLH